MTVKRAAQKRKRTSPGNALADPLVEWLNQAKMAAMEGNRQARESLERVALLIVALGKYTQQCSAVRSAVKTWPTTPKNFRPAVGKKFRRDVNSELDLYDDVTARLVRYRYVSPPVGSHDPRFRGDFGNDSFACYVTGFSSLDLFREADAALVVRQLADQNYLWKVRICDWKDCPRSFYYASKRNQRFCSDPCRFAGRAETDRVRAKKHRDHDKKEEREQRRELKLQGRIQPKRRAQR